MGVYLPNYEKPKGCFFKNTRCIFNDGLVCKPTGTRHNIPERLNCVLNNCPFEELDLVRCGECKHLKADGTCDIFADDNIRPSVSDFCSYGERRNDE